ncbi:hypothetical protein BDV98DRAFT_574602 [Pterulicium gracile]|uniref:Uncharacterized protein n=1 Tax=Pterulicium gracile TaxID=1884261 RepID=A0A5C3QGU4_9AGAR|nr:hypothetical protein BDV98DRAFT_574602 [Pterula gracilis]
MPLATKGVGPAAFACSLAYSSREPCEALESLAPALELDMKEEDKRLLYSLWWKTDADSTARWIAAVIIISVFAGFAAAGAVHGWSTVRVSGDRSSSRMTLEIGHF